jgi:hypothetical protein
MDRFERFLGVAVFVAAVSFHMFGLFVSHKLHEWGRTNYVVHEVMMTVDLVDFMHTAGGFTGASDNYFGWRYAKATADPNRPWWSKLLFWPNPYYVTVPPKEWPYSYQGR